MLDHKGRSKTAGAFRGLNEGTKLRSADTTYRISYRGGDGNDVVLTADRREPLPRRRRTRRRPAESAAADPRTANTASSGLGWWPYVLALGLLVGLAVPATRRRAGRRRGVGGTRRTAERWAGEDADAHTVLVALTSTSPLSDIPRA